MEKILNYINGELVEPINGNYLDNYNPSNGQVYSLISDSEKGDIDNFGSLLHEAWVEKKSLSRNISNIKSINLL